MVTECRCIKHVVPCVFVRWHHPGSWPCPDHTQPTKPGFPMCCPKVEGLIQSEHWLLPPLRGARHFQRALMGSLTV